MRTSRLLFVTLLVILAVLVVVIVGVRWTTTRHATEPAPQVTPVEYAQWQLPAGAKARLGKGEINAIEFSPDGTRFVVATTIGIWTYNARTGAEIILSEGDRRNVKDIVFSQDGHTLTSVNSAGEVRRWDAATSEPLSIFFTTEKINYFTPAVFSADGTKLTTVIGYDNVYVWDLNEKAIPPFGTMVNLEGKSSGEPGIALSSDGRFLATATKRATLPKQTSHLIEVWDTTHTSPLLTLTADIGQIETLAFSPDSKMLASLNRYGGKTIKLWDLETATHRATFKAPGTQFTTLAFSPNGKLLASGCRDGSVRLWNATAKQQGLQGKIGRYLPTLILKGHKDEVTTLAFSPDGKRLLSGSRDGTIRAWDTITGRQQFTCPGHLDSILDLVASKTGNILTSIHNGSDQIQQWNINSGHQLSSVFLKRKALYGISSDASVLAMLDFVGKNQLKLWDISNKRALATLEGHGYPSNARNFVFAFSLDKKRLASAPSNKSFDVIHLWDVPKQPQSFLKKLFSGAKAIRPRYTLEGSTGLVGTLTFSPNGKMLASGGTNTKILLWDVEIGHRLFTLIGHNGIIRALAFSSNGGILASASDGEIYLWDVATGQLLTTTETETTARVLQFSPDDKTLVSGGWNGTIQLLDAHTCNLLSTHTGHTHWISALVFSTDGKTLVSASRDGTILLWDWKKIAP